MIKLIRQEIEFLSRAASSMATTYRKAVERCGKNSAYCDILERYAENHNNLEKKLNSLLEKPSAQDFKLSRCDKK